MAVPNAWQKKSTALSQQDLGLNKALINPPPPYNEFAMNEPSWKEIQEVVRAARAASSPGPSGVPYHVYKHCPELLQQLDS